VKRQWLWLEDEEETVQDLQIGLRKTIDFQTFGRIPDLTRYLLEKRDEIESGSLKIGFILDVMISSAHAVTRPQNWFHEGDEERSFFTNRGSEAGLVFYEKCILAEDVSSTIFDPPPPVLFLTVTHTDRGDFANRLARLKEAWGRAQSVSPDEAKVKWVRKWDIDGTGLAELLQGWED